MYFSRALNRSLAPPDWVSVNLTMKCNLSCVMCTTCYDQANELSLEEVRSIIDQTALWGVEVFNPLGGEPFVRRDLEDILEYACQKNFYITLTTNGTLITRERAERLASIAPSRLHFNISLDGPQAVHDTVRGEGQYDRAMAGYARLREADAQAGNQRRKILVNTLIHNRNLDSLPAFLDTLEAEGFDGVQLLNLFRHGKSESADPGGLWIHPHQVPELEGLVEQLVARVESQSPGGFQVLNSADDLRLVPRYYRDDLEPLEAPCWSGWKELYIHSDGSAIMCDGDLEFLKGRFGSVRGQSLKQLWNSPELRERRRVVKDCSTPCIQGCYLRRDSDSLGKISRKAGAEVVGQVKQRLARRKSVAPRRIESGILTLELSDTAPWAPLTDPGPTKRFQAFVKDCPAPLEACYEDPFAWYQYRDKGYLDFGHGFMGLEVVRSILDDLCSSGLGFGVLNLSWRGEPLMHPEFALVLRHVLSHIERYDTFRELQITTDGRLFNSQFSDISLGFHQVPQTWILRGNAMAPYESQVLRNFDDYLSRRSPNQRVVASWVMEEAMDPHRFVETWAGRLRNPWMVAGRLEESGDGIWFARSDHDQFQATAEARRRLEEVAEVLGIPVDSGEESLPRQCPGAMATPVVAWDGDLTLCPWDRQVQNRVGDVTSDSLSRLWREDAGVLALRKEAIARGHPGKEICRDCHFVYSPNYRMALPEDREV